MTVSRIRMAEGGPEFSRIAQGLGGLHRWGKGPGEVVRHLRRCMHLGVTTLDVAPIYGDSEGYAETLLGEALALDPPLRDQLELVTKCCIGRWDTSLYHYDTSKTHILWSVEQSLSRLQTDRLDLLLIHRPDPLMDADEVAEAFTELREAGKVLHLGVNNNNLLTLSQDAHKSMFLKTFFVLRSRSPPYEIMLRISGFATISRGPGRAS